LYATSTGNALCKLIVMSYKVGGRGRGRVSQTSRRAIEEEEEEGGGGG
jgi:hypothetical protein